MKMSNLCPMQLLILFCWTVVTFAEPDISRLRTFLLQNYDKNLRPVKEDNDTTLVKMAYYVQHILQVDEKTETLSSEGIIKMEWTDQHLVWDPSQYGNITFIHLGDHEIWQPDVYLFRSAGDNLVDENKSTLVRVTSEGLVTWVPPSSIKVPCSTNYTYFPFEVHYCDFEWGSWTHNGDALLLQSFEDFILKPSDIGGGEWRINKWIYEKELYYITQRDNPYNSIHLRLFLQRTSSIHKITSVVPVVTSSILNLAGFWLDVWSTPRYVLGIGNFAVVALQLLHLGTTLPTGKGIPLLAQFSAAAVCMSAIFLVVTSALDSTQRRRASPPERLVRLCRSIPEALISRQSQSEGEDIDKAKNDWLLVCRVIDRILFWTFTIVYVAICSLLFSVA